MKIRIQRYARTGAPHAFAWIDAITREVTERGVKSIRTHDDEGHEQTFSLANGLIWYSVGRLRIHPDDLPGLRALPLRPIVLAKTKPAPEIDLNAHPMANVLREVVALDVTTFASEGEQAMLDAVDRLNTELFHGTHAGYLKTLRKLAALALHYVARNSKSAKEGS